MIVDLELLTGELINWYHRSTVKAINVVTVPYRGFEPLAGLLDNVLGKSRVLYITGPAPETESVEAYLGERGIEFCHEENPDCLTVVLDFDQAFQSRDRYDLIVYDDVNTFPTHRKSEMQELLNHVYYRTDHIMAYSMEPVFRQVMNLELPLKRDRSFVTEPRFIDLKGEIKTEIPSSVYEYIQFFQQDRRTVVIVVPDEETAASMTRYLCRVNPVYSSSIHFIDGVDPHRLREMVMRPETGKILFTTQIEDYRDLPGNFEFLVIHSDAPRFEYRQFVFLCLRSGLCDDLNGEVILVSHHHTFDMERTKELTQNYNRIIWESDQLFL